MRSWRRSCCFGLSIFAFSAGLVTGLAAVYAVAVVCLMLSGLSFLLDTGRSP